MDPKTGVCIEAEVVSGPNLGNTETIQISGGVGTLGFWDGNPWYVWGWRTTGYYSHLGYSNKDVRKEYKLPPELTPILSEMQNEWLLNDRGVFSLKSRSDLDRVEILNKMSRSRATMVLETKVEDGTCSAELKLINWEKEPREITEIHTWGSTIFIVARGGLVMKLSPADGESAK